MKLIFMSAFAALLIASSPVQAKPKHIRHQATAAQPRTFVDIAAIPAYGPQASAPRASYPMGRRMIAPVRSLDFAESIVGHPVGCPRRAFCGCGTSVKVFGRPIRELFLARNWLKFPRALPAAGMVAARSGHVFYIQSVNSDGSVVAYDPNSGNHQTRIHTVSLRGFKVVDPNGNAATFSARKIKVAHR